MATRRATPVIAAMASLLFALIVWAVWRVTHERDAVVFVVLSVGLVIVTTVWAVKTIMSENDP